MAKDNNIPFDLMELWKNDDCIDCDIDEITKNDIFIWNKFDEKQKQTFLEYGRFDYIYGYDDFYDTPIDIIMIHNHNSDYLDEKESILDILEGLVEKYGIIDNGKQYTPDQINIINCFLNLHNLVFYESVDTEKNSFPLPYYNALPIENIKRWKILCDDGHDTIILDWLEKNMRKNQLLDIVPMNRLYG